ncbi:GyrI-like domain-containing protein [Qipengyuania nanhaisediminis]|uniref:GyrI-like domain-containing protein n=1 Tax=Qipengyuania nanhaisediminis TaxID=604088 RepID=UPI0038B418DD
MADQIAIEQREAAHAVEIAANPRLWQIPKVLASGFAEARAHIERSGAAVEGMPFARYLGIDWDKMAGQGVLAQIGEFVFSRQAMRSGLFCSRPLSSEGNAIATTVPAGRYVTTYHRGAYHKVGDTYRRIVAWARENGVSLADSSLEHYIDDPTTMAMDEVRTQIWIAVRDE